MSDNVLVNPIRPENIEGFHQALDIVARERQYLAFFQAPSLQETKKFVLSNIENCNPHFVAIIDSQIVGWCDIRRHQITSQAHCGTLGMGIIPEYRDRGIGFRLLKSAMVSALETGFVRIEFGVRTDNLRAIALYEKAGFAIEGTHLNSLSIDGEYYDTVTMALVSLNINK